MPAIAHKTRVASSAAYRTPSRPSPPIARKLARRGSELSLAGAINADKVPSDIKVVME